LSAKKQKSHRPVHLAVGKPCDSNTGVTA